MQNRQKEFIQNMIEHTPTGLHKSPAGSILWEGELGRFYSYGKHFTVAQLDIRARTATVTTRRDSPTTSRHIGAVSFALVQAGYTVERGDL